MFSDFQYVGIDMEEGDGVDICLDFTLDFLTIDKLLNGKRFKTVFCFSVLEHCANPFLMCQNIEKILAPGGFVFIGAPFSWRIHGYPSDYWRFTPNAIKLLFPTLDFEGNLNSLSGHQDGHVAPIDNQMLRVELNIKKGLKSKQYGIFKAAFIYVLRKCKILPSIFDNPYLFPPSMVNMIGKKK
jgi:hypothetical protein